MASQIVLARKWRPTQFIDVIGQPHITRTLSNAVTLQRLYPAYLFTGTRGVGKTSVARIFAKILQCQNLYQDQGLVSSCDQCSECRSMIEGNHVDVIEIDGASHNGVESIREIKSSIPYMPAQGTKKIYIIDEVHMLTTSAFNALLKTLEEPPAHVLFILATTELQKIPDTILSRCQTFDYRKVSFQENLKQLIKIAKAEAIDYEPGTLELIARSAEGSVRDALSLLDQLIAFSNKKITLSGIKENFCLIESPALLQVLTAILEGNPQQAVHFTHQIDQQGHDLRIFVRTLLEFLHALLLIQVGVPFSPEQLISKEDWTQLEGMAFKRSLEELELIFQVFHHGLEWITRSPYPKSILDVLVIKCAYSKTEETVTALSSQNQPELSKFVDFVRQTRPLLGSLLEHATGLGWKKASSSQPAELSIDFIKENLDIQEQLQSRIHQETLLQLSEKFFGVKPRILLQCKEGGQSLAELKDIQIAKETASLEKKALSHPLVQEAQTLFGGTLSVTKRHSPSE